ncbi:MAG: chloride channel protein [Opitutaceae bacterium]|nr:chloride channel protein [Opitutaceae bacterium]
MPPPPPSLRVRLAGLRDAGIGAGLAALVGALAGTAGAGFLVALDVVTAARFAQPWLIAALPFAGVLMAWVYRVAGRDAERGSNLIIEQIHQPGGGVPLRMAPLVLGSTLLTHLCGGSAGREGTAVQMGGALAGGVQRALRLGPAHQSRLLSAGMAGGFGAVFGAPLAGAVFALEVLMRGRLTYRWLGPCLVAGFVGDRVCIAWGVHHADFRALAGLGDLAATPGLVVLAKAAVIGLACGLCARLFVAATHGVAKGLEHGVSKWWLRPMLGGAAVGGLAWLLGTDAYLGLGAWSPDATDPTLETVFKAGGTEPWSWLAKLGFTALTLGAGFKGGEVTPLFFIGAALGNALASPLGMSVALGAALGFVALFAGASKTPLACTLLAMELFGGAQVGAFAVACFVSYLASGAAGIYAAQRRPEGEGD